IGEDLPQPGLHFLLARALKLVPLLVGFQKSLLHHVGSFPLAAPLPSQVHAGQQPQIVAKSLRHEQLRRRLPIRFRRDLGCRGHGQLSTNVASYDSNSWDRTSLHAPNRSSVSVTTSASRSSSTGVEPRT